MLPFVRESACCPYFLNDFRASFACRPGDVDVPISPVSPSTLEEAA